MDQAIEKWKQLEADMEDFSNSGHPENWEGAIRGVQKFSETLNSMKEILESLRDSGADFEKFWDGVAGV